MRYWPRGSAGAILLVSALLTVLLTCMALVVPPDRAWLVPAAGAAALAAVIAAWFFVRSCVELCLEVSGIRWHRRAGSGFVPYEDIVAVRPMHILPSIEVIERRRGLPLVVPGVKGIADFLDELHRRSPATRVQTSRLNDLARHVPGPSAAATIRHCAECGEPASDRARYCSMCGRRLDG